jgi:nitronate monooxygenase
VSTAQQKFLAQIGCQHPIICGPMYPCSNPELVAAVSAAGGVGVIQPISMSYVHGHELRQGIRLIRRITDAPIGFNALVEASSKIYLERMRKWVDIALEEGIRFFITALGNPDWIVERVHAQGGVVYHDVTERRWADKGIKAGVDGLICVNNRAGGHTGVLSPNELFRELTGLGLPLVCAGGVGDAAGYREALQMGYAAVQMGTRFIATTECMSHDDYKREILKATAKDIVLTDKISGVPVSVIETDYVRKTGTSAGPILSRLLQSPRGKHYARTLLALRSAWQLKRASLQGVSYRDVFQAGKSVDSIHEVLPAKDIIAQLVAES